MYRELKFQQNLSEFFFLTVTKNKQRKVKTSQLKRSVIDGEIINSWKHLPKFYCRYMLKADDSFFLIHVLLHFLRLDFDHLWGNVGAHACCSVCLSLGVGLLFELLQSGWRKHSQLMLMFTQRPETPFLPFLVHFSFEVLL